MSFLKWVLGGALGAAVGIAFWTAVVYLTGYEMRLIAAFVGIFVGVGIAAAAGRERGKGAALFAACFAFLAVLGGKAAVAWVYSQKYMAEAEGFDATNDEYVISFLADDIVMQYEAAGYELDYPEDADLDYPDSRADYPEDVWTEAEAQWYAMAPEDRETFRANIAEGTEALPLTAFIILFVFGFGIFDLVWVGIAVSSAYKIVRDVPEQKPAGQTTVEEEPASFFPGLPPMNVPPTNPAGRRAESQPSGPGPFLPGMPVENGGAGEVRRVG